MARPVDPMRLTLVLICLFGFVGCSQEKQVSADRFESTEAAFDADAPEIVPSPAFGFHQLRLASDVSAASFGGLTGADRGQLVIWMINGKPVHTGPALDPSYTSPGDRVVAVVKAADDTGAWQELSRHETVVQDSAPRIQEVHLQRDASNPYQLNAVLRAEDPDGEPVTLRYRWFVDGNVIPNHAESSLRLDASAIGSRVAVEVTAHDDGLTSESHRSPEMTLESSPVSLEISSELLVQELENGRSEYRVAVEYTDGARIELLDAPNSVRYERGQLVWRPREDENSLAIRVRVTTRDGSSIERQLNLDI